MASVQQPTLLVRREAAFSSRGTVQEVVSCGGALSAGLGGAALPPARLVRIAG